MKAYAYAKVNLTLDVLRKREDGFHELEMIMQSVSLHDTLIFEPDAPFSLSCNLGWLPCDERNIVYKTCDFFAKKTGIAMQGTLFINKSIPVCAGLGGGSADCAATLALLNEYHKVRIDEQTLLLWATELGSDVPFCLTGGTALAKGRGEILKKLPDLPDCYIIICKPSGGISTRDAFTKIGNVRKRVHPDTQGALKSIIDGELTTLSQFLFNVFEDGAAQAVREIPFIRGELLRLGALGAVMSGSGSAVVGVFDEKNKALEAETLLKSQFTSTYLTRPTREGFRVVPEKSASEGAPD